MTAGVAVIFSGSYADEHEKSVHSLWTVATWLLFCVTCSLSYVYTHKVVHLYPYTNATAWYYVYTSLIIMVTTVCGSDFRKALASSDEVVLYPTKPVDIFGLLCAAPSNPRSAASHPRVTRAGCHRRYMVYGVTLFVYIGTSWVMTKVPVHVVSLFSAMAPLLGVVIAMIVLEKPMAQYEVVGGGLLMLAIGAMTANRAEVDPKKEGKGIQPRPRKNTDPKAPADGAGPAAMAEEEKAEAEARRPVELRGPLGLMHAPPGTSPARIRHQQRGHEGEDELTAAQAAQERARRRSVRGSTAALMFYLKLKRRAKAAELLNMDFLDDELMTEGAVMFIPSVHSVRM
jgi:hypothetical protein